MADRSRRTFLQAVGTAAALNAGTTPDAVNPSMVQVPFSGKNPRIGLIGTGAKEQVSSIALLAKMGRKRLAPAA
jgi:hypothetical protein